MPLALGDCPQSRLNADVAIMTPCQMCDETIVAQQATIEFVQRRINDEFTPTLGEIESSQSRRRGLRAAEGIFAWSRKYLCNARQWPIAPEQATPH